MSIGAIGSSVNTYTPPGGIKKILSDGGNLVPQKVADFFELTPKGSMTRVALFGIAAIFLLGARYVQARDEDEKREVFTRDFSAVTTAVYALPVLKKLTGLLINKTTKIPVAYGEEGILKNLNPEKGKILASFDQLEQWYVFDKDKKYKDGFKGFLTNLNNLGADLRLCFKKFGSETYKALESLKQTTGIIGELDNKNIINIINIIEKTENAPGSKEAIEAIKKAFGKENKLLKQAVHQKSLTEAGCIALTAGILGWFLPWFNIKNTKEIYKARQGEQNDSYIKNIPVKIDISVENTPVYNNFADRLAKYRR
ncbi:MAG TPA: hypothetical protein P5556_11090 [Candidatus Gastranaerophilales bacterium]|nr:hypothetical protein [Candidatus Gastranaerophilales bacterium]